MRLLTETINGKWRKEKPVFVSLFYRVRSVLFNGNSFLFALTRRWQMVENNGNEERFSWRKAGESVEKYKVLLLVKGIMKCKVYGHRNLEKLLFFIQLI